MIDWKSVKYEPCVKPIEARGCPFISTYSQSWRARRRTDEDISRSTSTIRKPTNKPQSTCLRLGKYSFAESRYTFDDTAFAPRLSSYLPLCKSTKSHHMSLKIVGQPPPSHCRPHEIPATARPCPTRSPSVPLPCLVTTSLPTLSESHKFLPFRQITRYLRHLSRHFIFPPSIVQTVARPQ